MAASTRDFTIRNYHEREISLDDGADSPRIPIRIRRFTVAQLQAFLPGFDRMVNPPSERVFARQPDGPEQQRDDQQRFVLPFAEVRRRRLAEMTPAQRTEFDREAQADQAAIMAFCADTIAQHVWLPPGVRLRIEGEDGELRTVLGVAGSKTDRPGEALAVALAGNLTTLMVLTRAVADENMLGADLKKAWRSSSSSRPSSTPLPDRGVRPETTAGSAAMVATARGGHASGRRPRNRSGSAGR